MTYKIIDMKCFFAASLFFLIHFAATGSNQYITGFVFDKETGEGLFGAHLYLKEFPYEGTITNEDGDFRLQCNGAGSDTLIISFIGYNTERFLITDINMNNLRIGLTPRSYNISEVSVSALSANSIINRVISSITLNHPEYPVYYSFYYREAYFTQDSIVDLMEEHTGIIEHESMGVGMFNNDLYISKSRIGYFTDAGKEKFENHRLVSFSELVLDNPLYKRSDHLHKRHSKRFTYKLTGLEVLMDKECYVISFETDKKISHPKGVLYIDTDSYTIVKEEVSTRSGGETRVVNFMEIDKKWYLSSVYQQKSRLSGLSHRTTLYNLADERSTVYDYVRVGEMIPEFVIKIAGDYNDDYWEGFNSVPLPNWIRSQINK